MLRTPFTFLKNLYRLLAFVWSWCWYRLRALFLSQDEVYVELELADDYQFGPPAGLARYVRDERSFLELREDLRRLADSDLVDGFVVRRGGMEIGAARADALRGLLEDVSERHNRVVSHLQMAATNRYLIHSAADTILLSPAGTLYTFGPRFDQFFAAETLDDLGLEAQFVHIGRFKTAAHRVLHDEMTDPQDLMMRAVHRDLHDLLTDRFADRRPTLEDDDAAIFAGAPLGARRARRVGAVDHLVSRARVRPWFDEGDETLPTGYGLPAESDDAEEPDESEESDTWGDDEDGTVQLFDFDAASGLAPPELRWMPLTDTEQRIAVVDLSGMIVMPDMQLPGSGGPVIDPDEVIPVLEHVRETPQFGAVLLHINSPGGSALASEIIGEAIEDLKREKPVAAYCTDVAASGGYYLASAADSIVCHRATVTGSIGVIVGKFSAPGIPEKLGVNIESIHEHDADTFTSLAHPLSDDLFERLGREARSFYRRFLRRVGAARQLPRRRLHRYARGRIYTGEQARDRNLVDELGDFETAFETVCRGADIDPDDTQIAFAPHRRPNLGDLIGLPVGATTSEWWPESLSEAKLAGEMLNREGFLALSPVELDVGQGR